MISRAGKHILNRLFKSFANFDEAAPCVAHFLNCLLGSERDPHPKPTIPAVTESQTTYKPLWTALTPLSLQQKIISEINTRFRYTLPPSAFNESLMRPQLLREFCLRCGLQLKIREYQFLSTDASSPISLSDNHSNGYLPNGHSSNSLPASTFEVEDVMNLVPIVKATPHRTPWIDEIFENGLGLIGRGQIANGEACVTEALGYYEQVHGALHPEIATRYHELAVLYHQIAGPLAHTTAIFETGHLSSSTPEERAAANAESGYKNTQAFEAAKHELTVYLDNAARMNRQSVILSERCIGLDHPETIQNFIDLAILEHANDHFELALKFSYYALALSRLVSGPSHPDANRILVIKSLTLSSEI